MPKMTYLSIYSSSDIEVNAFSNKQNISELKCSQNKLAKASTFYLNLYTKATIVDY